MTWWCLAYLLLLGSIQVDCSAETKKKGNGRIVGGNPVDTLRKYPFYAKVWTDNGKGGHITCGGTVLNEFEVLSASHCVCEDGLWPPANKVTVRTGDFTANEADEKGQTRSYRAAYYKYFIEYGSVIDGYDVVLIYVSTPIVFNDYCQPLPPCLDEMGFKNPLKYQVVGIGLGWITSGVQTNSYILREADFVELPPSVCLKYFGAHTGDAAVCLNKGIHTDTCYGDSGGPVVLMNNKTRRPECVYGVVSYGSGSSPCEEKNAPSVSMRVAYYYPLFSNRDSKKWEIKNFSCYIKCYFGFHELMSFTVLLCRLHL